MKNKKLFIDKIINPILVLALVFSLNINSFFIFAEELDNYSSENNSESSEILDENIEKNVESEEIIDTKDEQKDNIEIKENNKLEEEKNNEDILSEEETSDIENVDEVEDEIETINELVYEDTKIKVTVSSKNGFPKNTIHKESKLKNNTEKYKN